MSVYLGVDGGGTKTALCLVSEQGEVLATHHALSTYYLGERVGLVARVLTAAMPVVTEAAGIEPSEITFAFVGLPAYGEVSADLALLDAAPRAALGHDRYRCGNDMVCGWAGSLALEDGVNVVSGTGSISYGQRAERSARVGGWGELFGDEGSGYWIGIRGLQAFTRMSDGRLPAGPLLDVLREYLGLTVDLDAIGLVLDRWQGSRPEIAALSRQVVQAARHGDTVAAEILADAAAELSRLVDTTRRNLGFRPEETVPVSYSGGVFAVTEVRQGFEQQLRARDVPFDLREPQFPPVLGAALYAARLAGTPLGTAALDRLRRSSSAMSGRPRSETR